MTEHPHNRWRICKLVSWLLVSLLFSIAGQTAPPEYSTFQREQRLDYSPAETEVLRIWMVYVAQGDGIIIQLPTKYNYDPNPGGGGSERSERIDVVVDGGSNPDSDVNRMTDFIRKLYDGDSPTIEHIVITHHDQDHVKGITHLLGQSDIAFDSMYHNGLASYLKGKRNFSASHDLSKAVLDNTKDKFKRGMAFVDSSGEIEDSYLIKNIVDLRRSQVDEKELHGIYEELAKAVLKRKDEGDLKTFNRAHASAPFIAERETERATSLLDMEFKVLWPLKKAKAYGGRDWGETINGNSVTFRLAYKDFSMVFTGDHNDKSEPELIKYLTAESKLELLDCDVFKIPHHGSSHGAHEFFERSGFNPVLSVASMGNVGFKSKKMAGSGAWQHPATNIINWLGGPQRVYHTFIHEKELRYDQITTEAKRQSMIEKSHILIETDGKWFRLVEVPIDSDNPNAPPSVAITRRGNGTRWIKATKE